MIYKMMSNDPILKRRRKLNPYLTAGGNIYRRLIWDICLQSWLSRRKLSNYLNVYYGRKAIILCNGPSLNKVDFEKLGDSSVFTFGLNKINLLFDRTEFRPNCIVSANPFVIEQNRSFLNSTDLTLFIDSYGYRKGYVKPRENIIFYHSGGSPHGFARDCSFSINQGFTVTYVALQIAFHMGFKYVALVGADHFFSISGPPNKVIENVSIDESHFDPDYFSNVKWQLPDIFESEVSYRRADIIYNAHNRKIYNCTDGGNLTIFERKSIDEFYSITL